MQRVRNNFHPARRHTQKIRKDVRKLRALWRRDYYEKEPSPETLRAMKETEEMIEAWMKFQKEHEDD